MKMFKVSYEEYDVEKDDNVEKFERFGYTVKAIKNYEDVTSRNLHEDYKELMAKLTGLDQSKLQKDSSEQRRAMELLDSASDTMVDIFSALWVNRKSTSIISQESEDMEIARKSDWIKQIANMENMQTLVKIMTFQG